MHRVLALLILVCSCFTPLAAECWTNQAGRVIEARLADFDGAFITLVRTNGAHVQLPLKALREADQHRVRSHFGQAVAPEFVLTAYRDARSVLERFERLPYQQRTDESLAKVRTMACAAFDARLNPRARELKSPEVAAEVKRLRQALGGEEMP